MSPTKKQLGGFNPADEPRLTIAQIQEFWNLFQAISGSKTVKWLALAAGVSAILSGLHIVWLAVRYIIGR